MQSGVLQTQLLTTADQQHEQGDFQEMEQSGNLLQLADQQLMTNEVYKLNEILIKYIFLFFVLQNYGSIQ